MPRGALLNSASASTSARPERAPALVKSSVPVAAGRARHISVPQAAYQQAQSHSGTEDDHRHRHRGVLVNCPMIPVSQ